MDKTTYEWIPEEHKAKCHVKYGDYIFTGEAVCNEKDYDMENEHTGCNIAEFRANLKVLQFMKNCEIKPGLKSLMQLHHTMEHSKNHNLKSYESKMLYRMVKQYTKDLDTINKEIKNLQETLKIYIDKKDEFYKQVRTNRNRVKN